MSMQQEKPSCAACGGPIEQPFDVNGEFCKEECFRTGRQYCKTCNGPLPQAAKGYKRFFCRELCKNRYYQRGAFISPFLLEARNRSACKNCGNHITQPKGGTRQFCPNRRCRDEYHRTKRRNQDLLQEWGGYAPETRKVLRQLQEMRQINLARQLATAIDREYVLRRQDNPSNIRSAYIKCHCRTCGKEFQRRPWGYQNRDYCNKCIPSRGLQGENAPMAKLTWKQVDEIRDLAATGLYSYSMIGAKYSVTSSTIGDIVRYKKWKPEQDPRPNGRKRREGEGQSRFKIKLTWEQVDEIRNLRATQHLSYDILAEKYGVDRSNIWMIATYKTWKPENDPRRKSE